MENSETTPIVEPTANLNVWGESASSAPEISNIVEEVQTPVEPVAPVIETKVEPTLEVKTEPVVPEKVVVEKIVEKYPEFKDDLSKQLFEAIRDGKEDEVYSYLTKKNKNYDVMADTDVVKEKLKLDNPSWTEKDIEAEMKFKFGSLPSKIDLSEIDKDDDPAEYKRAVEFNESVDHKELLLSREARDARIALNETKKSIEFPSIKEPEAEKPKEYTQEEIDELNRKWESHVAEQMPKLSDFKFKVGDEEVTYKITDEDRASQLDYMKNFDARKMADDLGWIDANGNENVLKIAEDMLKLKNIDKIIASAATQMKTSATKEVVQEIKNIDLNTPHASPQLAQDLGAKIWS